MDGRELYLERWWKARMMGIVLSHWNELPPHTQRIWDEKAKWLNAT